MHSNLSHWCQWGDNEVSGNHCRDVTKNCRDWAGWTPAKNCWQKFIADHCMPPIVVADGGPSSQAGDYLWGCSIGDVRFMSPDVNTYMTPFDGASPVVAGSTQANDIKTFLNGNEKIKVFFNPLGIAKQNESWGSKWTTEWNDLLAGSNGLLTNNSMNGTSGDLVFLKGDTHSMRVVQYKADGTSQGLGGVGLNGVNVWEICPGTPNGSGSHDIVDRDAAWFQGGVMQRQKYAHPVGIDNTICSGCVHGKVSSGSLEINLIDLHFNIPIWSGTFSVGTNDPTYPSTGIGI